MKWIKITSEKDLPRNIHFRNHTEFWVCVKGLVFRAYFYNAYGGKSYCISEHNNDKIIKELRKREGDNMGQIEDSVDYYAIIERPNPPTE
jgi:hypothetical protein